jgi:hypothetical protein
MVYADKGVDASGRLEGLFEHGGHVEVLWSLKKMRKEVVGGRLDGNRSLKFFHFLSETKTWMTYLNKSRISPIETLLPICCRNRVSGIPPNITFCFPSKLV